MTLSFSSPETRFELVVSDEGDADGHHVGEPTGEVRCCECGRVAENIDEIPHHPECRQRWVRSDWWVGHLVDGE